MWRILSGEPYNSLLQNRGPIIKPLSTRHFYTIACGEKGIIGPDTPPTGVIFGDGTFLRIFEKWSTRDNKLLEYSYHYQIPCGLSIRYDKDSKNASPAHPEHHVQTNGVGTGIRLPTGEIRCEEVLQLIFEQFVMPKLPQR